MVVTLTDRQEEDVEEFKAPEQLKSRGDVDPHSYLDTSDDVRLDLEKRSQEACQENFDGLETPLTAANSTTAVAENLTPSYGHTMTS